MAQHDGDVEVEKMTQDSESAFREYLENSFPIDGKRTRSAVIRQALAENIARYLKGSTQNSDKRGKAGSSYLIYLPLGSEKHWWSESRKNIR